MRPELRQFATLRAEDFDRHPVWAQVHVLDYDEPWYDDEDVDEESFRPHAGGLPVSPEDCMYLVAAKARFADGSTAPAFLTPSDRDDLGSLQPHVLDNNKAWGFWGGLTSIPKAEQNELHTAIGKAPEQVFPLTIAALPGLATGITTTVVDGWSGTSVLTQKPVRFLRRLCGG